MVQAFRRISAARRQHLPDEAPVVELSSITTEPSPTSKVASVSVVRPPEFLLLRGDSSSSSASSWSSRQSTSPAVRRAHPEARRAPASS
jgi:hypothetical protein